VELQQKEQELEVQMLRIKNLKEKLLKENQGTYSSQLYIFFDLMHKDKRLCVDVS
jgi:hypothetical protein